ncbi:hypothetical protein [Brevibacillus ruminantium]
MGATIIHRVLTRLCEERGIRLNRTYQLNIGEIRISSIKIVSQ